MQLNPLTEFDLDAEIEAFIETSLRVSGNLSTDSSIEQQRQSYDAAWLGMYAMAHSAGSEGAITGLGIARGLRQMSSGTAISVGSSSWEDAQAALASGNSIDVTGASGHLDYDPSSEETTSPIEIWSISDPDLPTVGVCTNEGCVYE